MSRETGLRTEVLWFAQRMEEKLIENDHKGGWTDCAQSYLMRRLQQELDELKRAVATKTPEQIIRECADVANFAMMVASQYHHFET